MFIQGFPGAGDVLNQQCSYVVNLSNSCPCESRAGKMICTYAKLLTSFTNDIIKYRGSRSCYWYPSSAGVASQLKSFYPLLANLLLYSSLSLLLLWLL